MEFIMDLVAFVFNFLIYLVGMALNILFSFLPNSPFSGVPLMLERSGVVDLFGYVSYLIPIKQIISIAVAWATCIGLYFIYSIALRFVKAVD